VLELADLEQSFMVTASQAVIFDHWDGYLPVDPVKIARKLGVTVEFDPDKNPEVLGRFRYIDGRPHITVDANLHEPIRRFVVAHELGHYVLRQGDWFDDWADEFKEFPLSAKSRAAAGFARGLLMPGHAVEILMMKRHICDPRELVKMFVVPMTVLEQRLETLGWLPCKEVREAAIRRRKAALRRRVEAPQRAWEAYIQRWQRYVRAHTAPTMRRR
jgi:Zn-dependent peptidase ImmA (M78 family)